MKSLLLSLCTAALCLGFATPGAAQSGNGNFEPQHLAERGGNPGDVGAAAPAAPGALVASRTVATTWERTFGSRAAAAGNGSTPATPTPPRPAPPRAIRRTPGN